VSHPAGTATYFFTIADRNGNPMASGTTIGASVVGTGVTLSTGAPSSYIYPCTTEPITYGFSITIDGTKATAGENVQFTLDIKSAGGVETFANYTIPLT
jgi:hypothetical protein